MSEPIGLVAGWGRFPIVFAQKARAVGKSVVCVGLKHEASSELESIVDQFQWCGPLQLGKMIRYFRRKGVHRMVFAGKVHKAKLLYRPWRLLQLIPDPRALIAWLKHRWGGNDARDDTLTLAVIREFNRDGIEVDSALNLCPELLIPSGILTKRKPSSVEESDIHYGWDIARKMGEFDIGQSVVVKDGSVIAVEAIEGTDQAIARAGTLCRSGGFIVVKVAKPNQDMRFDVPTIGTSTIENIHKAKGRVLAIEAKKTIVLDLEDTVELANRYGITIVALES